MTSRGMLYTYNGLAFPSINYTINLCLEGEVVVFTILCWWGNDLFNDFSGDCCHLITSRGQVFLLVIHRECIAIKINGIAHCVTISGDMAWPFATDFSESVMHAWAGEK